jgi:hypothetical protein
LVTNWALLTLKVWETSSVRTSVIIISQHSPIPGDLNLHRDISKNYSLSKGESAVRIAHDSKGLPFVKLRRGEVEAVFVHFGHVIFRIIVSAVFSLKIISVRT